MLDLRVIENKRASKIDFKPGFEPKNNNYSMKPIRSSQNPSAKPGRSYDVRYIPKSFSYSETIILERDHMRLKDVAWLRSYVAQLAQHLALPPSEEEAKKKG